ncbi:MAG: ornithine carbamoyltransferase [Lentisphaeria bacterium]
MKIHPNLHQRNFLTLNDLSDEEMAELIRLSRFLRKKKNQEYDSRQLWLRGKSIALLFEKSSTRTRCAATVAAADEGAHVEYLGTQDIHLGKKESVADTAKVLGGMFDAILFRGFEHATVSKLAEFAGVPVWNGLTDKWHPTQALADLITVRSHFGHLEGLKLTYMGDGRNNVCNSLMLACAKAGINFVNCCPPQLAPPSELIESTREKAAANGASITVTDDISKAAEGANVLYTDVWVSMGEEDKMDERIKLLRPYQVNSDVVRATGNENSDNLIFMHCLPAFHNHDTDFTRDLGPLEVTDEVFESDFSRVFQQAENRMHTIKALMVATLKEE